MKRITQGRYSKEFREEAVSALVHLQSLTELHVLAVIHKLEKRSKYQRKRWLNLRLGRISKTE